MLINNFTKTSNKILQTLKHAITGISLDRTKQLTFLIQKTPAFSTSNGVSTSITPDLDMTISDSGWSDSSVC